jgi:hypothetical protein
MHLVSMHLRLWTVIVMAGVVACRDKDKTRYVSTGRQVTPAAPEPVIRTPEPALPPAGPRTGRSDRAPRPLTVDSLPQAAKIALRFDARTFVPYRAQEYDERLRRVYPGSKDEGMFIIRANLQGMGPVDYVVAGRNKGVRSVLAVMRRTEGGWTLRNVTQGEIGTRAPQDSASLWLTRADRRHPNGEWDGVAVKRLYVPTAAPEVYYWNAERKEFFLRQGPT